MNAKEFYECRLVPFLYAFELKDFPEIGVGAIPNVDEICLDQTLGW
jgi:hypothetical protein